MWQLCLLSWVMGLSSEEPLLPLGPFIAPIIPSTNPWALVSAAGDAASSAMAVQWGAVYRAHSATALVLHLGPNGRPPCSPARRGGGGGGDGTNKTPGLPSPPAALASPTPCPLQDAQITPDLSPALERLLAVSWDWGQSLATQVAAQAPI
jgi:hypothetical protein